MRVTTTPFQGRRATGFSLLEILMATIILGLGLIMVASIFPVGANWNRQSSEETIATNLAWNACSLVRTHYAGGGFITPSADSDDAYYLNGAWVAVGTALGVAPRARNVFSLPNFGKTIPVSERTYAVGSGTPFPVPVAPANKCIDAHYFWTALMRVPDDNSTTVTLYILVFRRGAREQVFTSPGSTASLPGSFGPFTEIKNCRDQGNANEKSGTDPFTPSVWLSTYQAGTLSANSTITKAWPPMGSFGIGSVSGTVFRQSLNTDSAATGYLAQAAPSTLLKGQANAGSLVGEKIITAVPPDGSADSPLIFIYQTQLSF